MNGAVIKTWWQDLLDLIFPRTCEVCGRKLIDGEKLMCLHCNVQLPRTRFHLQDFNSMHQRLMRHAHIDRAAAWFHYHRTSPYVSLIHKAKYRDRPEIARDLAVMYAREIRPDGFFTGIDCLLPVPMHRVKQFKRGYNQAAEIAKGISAVTGIPLADNLYMRHSHSSQTTRRSYERYMNVNQLFGIKNPQELDNRHVLIIDDVITTGSTLLACSELIKRQCPSTRISILTLAAATLQ